LNDEPGCRLACVARLNAEVAAPKAADEGQHAARAQVHADERSLHQRRLLERELHPLHPHVRGRVARGAETVDAHRDHVADREDVGRAARRRGRVLGLEGPRPGHRRERHRTIDAGREFDGGLAARDRGDDAGIDAVLLEGTHAGSAGDGLGRHPLGRRRIASGVCGRLGLAGVGVLGHHGRLLLLFPRRGLLVLGLGGLRPGLERARADALEIEHLRHVGRGLHLRELAPERGAGGLEPVGVDLQLGPAEALPLVHRAQAVLDRGLRHGLQLGVHRHFDGQAGGVHRRVAELRDQLAPDFFEVPRAGRIGRRQRQHDGPVGLALVVVFADEVIGEHPRQHVIAAVLRAVGVAARIDARGVLRQAGEDGGLAQIDVLNMLVEVIERCFFNPIVRLAEVDVIQIEEEDIVFRQVPLEPRRQ
jgi:hypothetical protein